MAEKQLLDADQSAMTGDIDTHGSGAFLSGAPRSGEVSPYAQKVSTEAFVWLASLVVFAGTADYSRSVGTCNALCGYGIAVGIVSFIFASLILLAHCFVWLGRIDRNGWFTNAAEMRFMVALVIWWGPGVGGLSAVNHGSSGVVYHTSGLALFFGWLAFFATIYGAYKAYHSKMEEQSYLSLHQQMSIEAENEEEHYANFA
jgi:hypothetical protein